MYIKKREKDLAIKAIMIILILMAVVASEAKTVVCILDSGVSSESKVSMCNGEYDTDELGHGTDVAKTIVAYAGNNYCIKSYKIFFRKPKKFQLKDVLDVVTGCDVINLSIDSDVRFFSSEYKALYDLSKRSKIFISAGNAGQNLDKKLLFPVGYKLITWTIVGNKNVSSNYGSIVNQIESFCYDNFCGTSASVAIATGKYVKGLK